MASIAMIGANTAKATTAINPANSLTNKIPVLNTKNTTPKTTSKPNIRDIKKSPSI